MSAPLVFCACNMAGCSGELIIVLTGLFSINLVEHHLQDSTMPLGPGMLPVGFSCACSAVDTVLLQIIAEFIGIQFRASINTQHVWRPSAVEPSGV